MAEEILKNIEMLPDEVEFVSNLKVIAYTAKAKAYQAADLYNVATNWRQFSNCRQRNRQNDQSRETGWS